MTANHPAIKLNNINVLDLKEVGKPEGTAPKLNYLDEASTKYYWQIEDHIRDEINLCNSCQMHECNSFCLRKRNNMTYCRCNFGKLDKNTNKTPGMATRSVPGIVKDSKDIKRLCMPRNSTRMNQTSMTALKSWRANCDVQLIIYDSDPVHPDLNEIAKITDYVVSYTCKGNVRQSTEKNLMKDLVFK